MYIYLASLALVISLLESVLCRALTIYNKTTKNYGPSRPRHPASKHRMWGMQLMAGILKAQMGGTT